MKTDFLHWGFTLTVHPFQSREIAWSIIRWTLKWYLGNQNMVQNIQFWFRKHGFVCFPYWNGTPHGVLTGFWLLNKKSKKLILSIQNTTIHVAYLTMTREILGHPRYYKAYHFMFNGKKRYEVHSECFCFLKCNVMLIYLESSLKRTKYFTFRFAK